MVERLHLIWGCLLTPSSQVAATLHKVEQAKYWVSLKRQHSSPGLPARAKAAVEEQMTACVKCMQAPPAKELIAMVQAACEEEVRRSRGYSLVCKLVHAGIIPAVLPLTERAVCVLYVPIEAVQSCDPARHELDTILTKHDMSKWMDGWMDV